MKNFKKLSVLLCSLLLLAGCSGEKSVQTDKPIYETFVIDEEIIVNTERKEITENLYDIVDYDSEGRVVRSDRRSRKEDNISLCLDEFVYGEGASLTHKRTQYEGNTDLYHIIFWIYDEAGEEKEYYYYINDKNADSWRISNTVMYEQTDTGRVADYTIYNEDGSVRAVRCEEEDEEGNVIHSVKTDNKGTVVEQTFDPETLVSTQTNYKDGAITSKIVYQTTDEGGFNRKEVYGANDILTEFWKVENGVQTAINYYPDGSKKTEEIYDTVNGTRRTITYDENGNVVSDVLEK